MKKINIDTVDTFPTLNNLLIYSLILLWGMKKITIDTVDSFPILNNLLIYSLIEMG